MLFDKSCELLLGALFGLLSLASPRLVGVLLLLRGGRLGAFVVAVEALALLRGVSTPSMFSAELVAPAFRGVLLLLLWLGWCLLLGNILTVEVFGGSTCSMNATSSGTE